MKSTEDSGEETDKKSDSRGSVLRLTRGERIFLKTVNIFIIAILIPDLMFFLGLVYERELKLLAIGNICVLVLAFFSYLVKRRIRRRISRISREINNERASKGDKVDNSN